MHPIEHLRYVARARGAEPAQLAREAAIALGTLRADHANLVVASRRIIGRHPEAGQLWWLCSQLLVADDPAALAWELADRLGDDPVVEAVARSVPDAATVIVVGDPPVIVDGIALRADVGVRCLDSAPSDLARRFARYEIECEPIAVEQVGDAGADIVLMPAVAASVDRVLTPVGGHAVAAAAAAVGIPVWLVAGTGTRLPSAYVVEIERRVLDEHGTGSIDEVELDLIDRIVGEDGPVPRSVASLRPDCPLAPELLRTGVT